MVCLSLVFVYFVPAVVATEPTSDVSSDVVMLEQVKEQLSTGEITDPSALFLVAFEHLDADIEEDGMTSRIAEDGSLNITQIVKREKTRSAETSMDFTSTTLMLLDNEGRAVTEDYKYYYNALKSSNSGGLDKYMVYATQTAYYNVKVNPLATSMYVQLNYMTTTLAYGSSAFSASKLVQSYENYSDFASSPVTGSKTTNAPSAGTYTYKPSGMSWYSPTSGNVGGGIITKGTVTIKNSTTTFQVTTTLRFADIPYKPEW